MVLAFLQSVGPMEIFVVVFVFGFLGLWLTALISVARRQDLTTNSKILWIVLLAIGGIVTALIYWIVRLFTRPKGIPEINTFEKN